MPGTPGSSPVPPSGGVARRPIHLAALLSRLALTAVAALPWPCFHRRDRFRDPSRASDACSELHTSGFHAPGRVQIPVAADGTFDVRVPARVYRVVNVNSTGYSYNALERWAWDYDLIRDHGDDFAIGRAELHGIRAFEVVGGLADPG